MVLTERQQEVLEAFQLLEERDGKPPTIRALMERLGIRNTNGMMSHFRALERKGYMRHVQTESHQSSCWRLVKDTTPTVEARADHIFLRRSSREETLSPAEARALAARLLEAANEV